MEKRLFPENKFLMIPSWGKLLGYPTLGTYKNRQVTNISSDPVTFLSGMECTIKTEEETYHYLFGIGTYYTKFQIDQENYIIDKRNLTGLILSDFVYQFLMNSKDITLQNDEEVILTDLVCKFPIKLTKKTHTQLSFIKGTLIRKIFIPYKETFVDFVKQIQEDSDSRINVSKHLVLSAYKDHFNTILYSNKMPDSIQDKYLETTAGISAIIPGIDSLLTRDFSENELSMIESNINYYEEIFKSVKFDPIYPFSIIFDGNVALHKNFISQYSNMENISFLQKSSLSDGVFCTASKNYNTLSWPNEFPRRTLESWGMKPKEIEIPKLAMTDQDEKSIEKNYNIDMSSYNQGPTENQQQFQINSLKNPHVETKSITSMPQNNVKDILNYIKQLIDQNYEMRAIGDAYASARDIIRKLAFHTDYIWEMSKNANYLQKQDSNAGLNQRDKDKFLESLNAWIFEIDEKERIEREKIEKERQHLENERLAQLKKKQEQKKREEEIQEKQRKEIEKFERINIERKQQENEVLEQQRLQSESAKVINSTKNIQINTYSETLAKITEIKLLINQRKTNKAITKEGKKMIKKEIKELKNQLKSLTKKAKSLKKRK